MPTLLQFDSENSALSIAPHLRPTKPTKRRAAPADSAFNEQAERARKLATKSYMLETENNRAQYVESGFLFNPENPTAYFEAIGLTMPQGKYALRELSLDDIHDILIWSESKIEPGRVPDGYWESKNYRPHFRIPDFAIGSFDNLQQANAAYLTWPPAQYAA